MLVTSCFFIGSHILIMSRDMFHERLFPRERSVAQVARVRLLPRVRTEMLLESRRQRERLPALVTRVRPLTRVRQKVDLQVDLLRKRLPAHVAHERLPVGVDHEMLLQTAHLRERLTARFAHERFQSRVSDKVLFQVPLSRKSQFADLAGELRLVPARHEMQGEARLRRKPAPAFLAEVQISAVLVVRVRMDPQVRALWERQTAHAADVGPGVDGGVTHQIRPLREPHPAHFAGVLASLPVVRERVYGELLGLRESLQTPPAHVRLVVNEGVRLQLPFSPERLPASVARERLLVGVGGEMRLELGFCRERPLAVRASEGLLPRVRANVFHAVASVQEHLPAELARALLSR